MQVQLQSYDPDHSLLFVDGEFVDTCICHLDLARTKRAVQILFAFVLFDLDLDIFGLRGHLDAAETLIPLSDYPATVHSGVYFFRPEFLAADLYLAVDVGEILQTWFELHLDEENLEILEILVNRKQSHHFLISFRVVQICESGGLGFLLEGTVQQQIIILLILLHIMVVGVDLSSTHLMKIQRVDFTLDGSDLAILLAHVGEHDALQVERTGSVFGSLFDCE